LVAPQLFFSSFGGQQNKKVDPPPIPMTLDLASGINQLAQTADHLAELVEWQRLAEQELRLGAPIDVPLKQPFEQDARELYGLFLQLDQAIHEVLKDRALAGTPRNVERWSQQVLDLERKVWRLRIRERFIKP
jgi:hypothetical protein